MLNELANSNLNNLKQNAYPGRGIIIGKTPDDKCLVQVYWIMGRSANSRNRVFVNENGNVKTKLFDESKATDPSLIIYYPVRFHNNIHIVSNGNQTDTVYEFMKSGKSFEDALLTREYEPDEPNFTPRITGITEVGGKCSYKLSILKAQNPGYCVRNFFHYEKAIPGFGHCLHTYSQDGNPLPSFSGEPYLLSIPGDMDETADMFWSALNEENRISLLVKYIDAGSGEVSIKIINKFK